MKKIGLVMMGLVLFAQAELIRGTNDLTVIDTEIQLEWQDSYPVTFITYSFGGAIDYCENLDLDNKNDWRVPNINELKTIVLDTQYAPSIDEKFKNTKASYYWSSTQTITGHRAKMGVNFENGTLTRLKYDPPYNSAPPKNYVCCVRAGQ